MGLFSRKTESTDLTSREAVAKSQEVYDRLGDVEDVAAELRSAHGRRDDNHR